VFSLVNFPRLKDCQTQRNLRLARNLNLNYRQCRNTILQIIIISTNKL